MELHSIVDTMGQTMRLATLLSSKLKGNKIAITALELLIQAMELAQL